MKNKIIVTIFVVVAGLAAMGYALTAGKSVSAKIHGQTEEQQIQEKTEVETLL